jgi:hypothetical protein
MPIPFEELPPEMQAQVAEAWNNQHRQVEMHSMAIESARHRIVNFLESLDEENLYVLQGMLKNLVADTDNETAGFYNGLIAGLLAKKGVCLMCHVRHPDPLAEADKKDDIDKHAEKRVTEGEGEVVTFTADAGEGDEEITVGSDRYYELVAKYNLKRENHRLICLGCGTPYVNLRDRMLRKPGPEGCEGCKQTTKWGGVAPTYDPTIGGDS